MADKLYQLNDLIMATTLAREMFKEYVQKVNDEKIRKNIEESLEDIKDAMLRHEEECVLLVDWQDLPDDWVVLSETIDYLRDNGFTVRIEDDNKSGWGLQRRVAYVTWPTEIKEEDEY